MAVECFSDANCAILSLGTLCGSGSRAVSISCSQVKSKTGATSCVPGSGAVCKDLFANFSPININNMVVGDFCSDTTGFDAIVWCESP